MHRALTTAIALALSTAAADATTVYFNDFDDGQGLDGTGAIVDAQGYDGVNGISDSFWWNDSYSEASTLNLSGLGAHDWMTVAFDIAFIDSWDGAIGRIYGDDFFNIVIDGVTTLLTTNFGGLADELSDEVYGYFGFTEKYDDEAYRYSATFAHSGDTADLSFFADGIKWQAGSDESWAIDNLSVSVGSDITSMPIPGGLPLMAGALGALALFQRRRSRSREA